MAANPAPSNPCCAALLLRCSKLDDKRNALRQGCQILKDQLGRFEGENVRLKKAYDEERARADHEKDLKEKETAFRTSVEAKVAEMESQLSSLQHAGSPQFQNLDKELMILQGKLSEREAEIDRFKQLLEEETRKTNAERENAKVERQKAMKLNEALEAQKNRAKEACTCNLAEAKTVDDSECNIATLLKYEELADENERKFTEERSYANDLPKQLEEATLKVELLQKEVLALKAFRESSEAGFAMQLSEKEAELKHLRDLLEVAKSRADVEQKKAATLQETFELEKIKSLKSSNLAQAETTKAKESLLQVERLKNEVSKLTVEQSKRDNMTKMYEAEKQNVLRERQRADAEKVKVVELKKLAEENEKRVMQEKSNSERLLKQMEEETRKVETLQKQVQELLSCTKSTASVHSDSSELKEAYSKLETENRRLIKEKRHMEKVKGQELKRLAEENDKKVMEERSNSKQLAQQMEAERQTIKMLQKQVQELSSSANSTASAHSSYLKLKEAYSKLEDQNRMLIRERKHIEAAEMGKLDDLRKLSEANGKRYFEEKCRADRSSHDLEMGKQKLKELEKELHSLKLSRKLVGNSTLSTVPDVNISSPILLHEQLKLEKKRLKHSKQVAKFEKYRNDVLQRELGKLKQDFVRTVQHLDMLEKTFCWGAQTVDKSTKSTDLSKFQSLCLNKMLLGSNLFGTLEDGPVVPGSSARCALDFAIPTVYSQPDSCTESPSGITTKLSPLVGDGLREISPSSAMDSSEASFPDKQLLGSQEQVAGSLPTSTIVVDGNTNPKTTISKYSDQAGKRKYSAHAAAVVANSSRTPLDNLCADSEKRRKILHEFESLEYMQLETRRLDDGVEKKLSKRNSKLSRLTPGPMEDAGCLLPDRVAVQHDGPCKKRKASHKPEENLVDSHCLPKQIKGDNLLAPAHLPAIKEGGSAQTCVGHISGQDTLLVFEQQIQGNVMKLLELDNEADEELFRTAMKNPLSPTLPNINHEDGGLVGIDPSGCGVVESSQKSVFIGKDNVVFGALVAETNSKSKSYDPGSCSIDLGIHNNIVMERNKENVIGVGFEQVGDGKKTSSTPISISDGAKQTDSYQSGMTVETVPLFCILFSFMEDIKRIRMMLFATRRCLTQCRMHSQPDRILMELFTNLASEQQLTLKEKVCVFFSLTLHNFLQVSLNKSEVYFNQGSLCSFPSYICSVLSDFKNRGNMAELFCCSELFCLFEEFVCQKRIIFCGDKDTDANNFTSRYDILLEGKKVVLYEKTASTHEVFAGSVIFSSICLAVGQISILWDFSYKVLQTWPADSHLILYILHGFAFVCGEKYFLTSNYRVQMEVVKSLVNVLENSNEVHGATLSQSDSKTCQRFFPCDRCPFAKSLRPLDVLSMLVEELGKYASMAVDGVDSPSSLSIPDYAPNKDIYGYMDIMSSVELISIIMGWSWTADKVLPELRKLLPSSVQGNFSTSLVLLLGRIGRFGVKSCGYEDAGIKSLKQYMSSLSGQTPLLEHNHKDSSALFLALDGISQHKEKGPQKKLDCPSGLSAALASIRKCYLSPSSEQKPLKIQP